MNAQRGMTAASDLATSTNALLTLIDCTLVFSESRPEDFSFLEKSETVSETASTPGLFSK